MFLVEKLPKESEVASSDVPLDRTTALENEILKNIGTQLHSPWMPDFCKNTFMARHSSVDGSQTVFRDFIPKKLNLPFMCLQSDLTSEFKEYLSKKTPSVFQQTDKHDLIPSLIASNEGSFGLGSKDETDKAIQIGSRLTNLNSFEAIKIRPLLKDVNLEAVQAQNSTQQYESPLENLNVEIEKLKQTIEQNVLEHSKMISDKKDLNLELEENEKIVTKLKNQKKIKERTHIMLEDPAVNLKKLEDIINAGHERMKKMTEQWEEHREPLVKTLEASNAKHSDKWKKSELIIEQTNTTRQKCDEIIEEIRNKALMHSKLLQELDKMNKTVSRTAYTSRILEIIGNIKKQKGDIDKVLTDTRALQKEINSITGQLDRQFTVTDDLIFRTAKKDDFGRRAYKLLVTLHTDCGDLVSLVQETGAIMREVRDLEDQIENEKTRNASTNLERITADLQQMEAESLELVEKIRQLEATLNA